MIIHWRAEKTRMVFGVRKRTGHLHYSFPHMLYCVRRSHAESGICGLALFCKGFYNRITILTLSSEKITHGYERIEYVKRHATHRVSKGLQIRFKSFQNVSISVKSVYGQEEGAEENKKDNEMYVSNTFYSF